MAHYPQGITLKALLENPDLINPPKNSDGDGGPKKKDDSQMMFPGQSAFLGPDIWGRSSPTNDDDDFKFEYMDLEEFLSENGIPVNGELFGSDVTKDVMQQQQPSPDPMAGNVSPQQLVTPPLQRSYSPQLSISAPSTPEGCVMSPGIDVSSPVDMMASFHGDLQKPVQALGLSMASPSSSSVSLEDSQDSVDLDQSKPDPVTVDFTVQEQDLLLANPPGQYEKTGKLEFDPRCRSFRSEELRPQPMIKKSRKIFVNDEQKDDKYWARRKKNNIAAKRSRDARRIKENQIALRAAFLEKQNSQLMDELDKMLQENKTLKDKLVKYEGNN